MLKSYSLIQKVHINNQHLTFLKIVSENFISKKLTDRLMFPKGIFYETTSRCTLQIVHHGGVCAIKYFLMYFIFVQ